MKVLIAIPCLMTGGTEVQTLSLAKALLAAGHQVTTACYFEYEPQMVARYEEAGCNVVCFIPRNEAKRVKDAKRQQRIPPAPLYKGGSAKRPKGVIRTAWFLYKGLRRIVRSEHPDVVHVQYMAPGAIPIVILRLLGVKKIIATAHTAADIYPSLRLLHWITNHLLIAFTCITERAEQSFFGSSSLYTPDTQLAKKGNHFTIYNCLPDYISILPTTNSQLSTDSKLSTLNSKLQTDELDCFVPRNDAKREQQPTANSQQPTATPKLSTINYQLSTDSKLSTLNSKPITIGVVGRLERIKGADLILPAFAKIHAKHPNTRLLIVGNGSLREAMEAQLSTINYQLSTDSKLSTLNSKLSTISAVGTQPQERLQDYYDRIDILLMPSRSEGFGLTALEGMARGCVVVAANIGGLPELVIDGQTGLLHRPEDIDDITEKVSSLLNDPQRMSAMSAAAIERAKLFSKEHYDEQIKNLYKKLQT